MALISINGSGILDIVSVELAVTLSQDMIKVGTVKILKFRTPQTIAIIVLKVEKFDVTLH